MYGKVLVYLPTKLGNFGQGHMLVCISQHHGSHLGYGQIFNKKHQHTIDSPVASF